MMYSHFVVGGSLIEQTDVLGAEWILEQPGNELLLFCFSKAPI